MTGAAASVMFVKYVAEHPEKAARAALGSLIAPTEMERERGRSFAAAVHAADRCILCGRPLEVEESKAIGVGPDCLAQHPERAARAVAAYRAAGVDIPALDLPKGDAPVPEPETEAEVPAPGTPLDVDRPAPRHQAKRAEGKAWDDLNSDGSPNVGSYAVHAAAGMVNLALRLVVAANRVPTVELVEWTAERLMAAADDIQAHVRSDGRSDRMANSHSRARGVLHDVVGDPEDGRQPLVPFPVDAATLAGAVPPDRADEVHDWHRRAVATGTSLLSIAVRVSGTDWRNA